MRDRMDWKDMLLPGDWVILQDGREVVIINKRENSYWIETGATEGEQNYQLIPKAFIKSVSKNLEHWFMAV